MTSCRLSSTVALGIAWIAALGLAACAAEAPKAPGADATIAAIERGEMSPDGLVKVNETRQSRLWVKPDHYLGHYDDVFVTSIAFAYARGQERLSAKQEEQVGAMLIKAVNGITEGTPVGQATEPGECVVALKLLLNDIRLHISESSGSTISYVNSFGAATMIVEFQDSLSEDTLIRYMANRGLGGGTMTGRLGANLGRLGNALGGMVTDMMTELQTIVPDTTARGETPCNNGIYKMTGRGGV